MTEEEKRAIEYFKRRIANKKTAYTSIYFKIEKLETVLNLVQNQDTEINKLNNVIDRIIAYIKDNYDKFEIIEVENNGIKETRYLHKFNIEYLLNILNEERRGEYE